jgi:hypothetical protein
MKKPVNDEIKRKQGTARQAKRRAKMREDGFTEVLVKVPNTDEAKADIEAAAEYLRSMKKSVV